MSELRSITARAAAELALVRVVSAYGMLPEFVVLGGLVPALLCTASSRSHAGTTDIDVQVNLEISMAAVNAGRLEAALLTAGFTPASRQVWRWTAPAGLNARTVVKFELLADLDDKPAEAEILFDGAARLGAVNLRGTGRAVDDVEIRTLTALDGDKARSVEVRVTGLAGFLVAKVAAAHSRRTEKDWYDIAFVLQHNDAGGPEEATAAVRDRFRSALRPLRSGLLDLAANFADDDAQGPVAYAAQLAADHPDVDTAQARTDAQLAVSHFCTTLLGAP